MVKYYHREGEEREEGAARGDPAPMIGEAARDEAYLDEVGKKGVLRRKGEEEMRALLGGVRAAQKAAEVQQEAVEGYH